VTDSTLSGFSESPDEAGVLMLVPLDKHSDKTLSEATRQAENTVKRSFEQKFGNGVQFEISTVEAKEESPDGEACLQYRITYRVVA